MSAQKCDKKCKDNGKLESGTRELEENSVLGQKFQACLKKFETFHIGNKGRNLAQLQKQCQKQSYTFP